MDDNLESETAILALPPGRWIKNKQTAEHSHPKAGRDSIPRRAFENYQHNINHSR